MDSSALLERYREADRATRMAERMGMVSLEVRRRARDMAPRGKDEVEVLTYALTLALAELPERERLARMTAAFGSSAKTILDAMGREGAGDGRA